MSTSIPGGILYQLKKRGWGNELKMFTLENTDDFSLTCIQVQLTEEGLGKLYLKNYILRII